MRQYIPKIDLDDHLRKCPPVEIKNFHEDNLIHILDLITEIPARSDSHQTKDGYIPLNSTLLRKKIRNYNQYLNYLVSTGVLLCDNHYINGEKSRGYKFNEKYFTKIMPVEITKFTLIKSIKAEKKDKNRVPQKYEYLVNWFEDLTIDPSAFDYLETKYAGEGCENSINKYNSTRRSLDWIKDHTSYFTVDNSVSRMHTALTSLESDFRKFVYCRDKPLVSIDITNSQPFLSIILFDREFYETNTKKINIHKLYNQNSTIQSTLYTSISTNLSNSHIQYTIHPQPSPPPPPPPPPPPFPPPMLYKILENEDNYDVTQYKELAENGLIYQYLGDEIYNELGIDLRGNRKELKKVIFTVLFTGNQFIGQPEAGPKRIFKNRFSTVYKLFALLKRNNKTELSILLQRIESFIVLDIICPRIRMERPDMPIFTIHDSILTTFDNEDYLYRIMEEELFSAIGHKPTLKIEYFVIQKV